MYVDNVQIDGATTDLQDIYYHEEGNLFFGHYYSGDWLAFSGYLDEVRFWNRALTVEEVIRNCQLRLEVDIDIKPGSYPNCFNVNGHGVIPVAINGSADFDVNDIDIDTLLFAGLAVRVKGNGTPQCSIDDWNEDGYVDLVCQFVDDPATWEPNNATATLTGELLDGTPIEGSDEICIVP